MFLVVLGYVEAESEIVGVVRHRIGGSIRTRDPIAKYYMNCS
jgi:hypothetical protein